MVPPQAHIALAANILGTIGTVLWCIQLIPQIWQNWRRKSTEGVPASMMILWASCGPPLGVYAIVQSFNIPMQVQPQCFTVLTIVTWSQTLAYGKGWSVWRATIAGIGLSALLGGIEVMLVFSMRIAYRREITWPIIFMGVLAVLLNVAGLVPLYIDILKRRGRVVGINFVFLTMDSLGALFSLASVAAQNEFDPLGASSYIAIFVCEAIVFFSHWIWLARHRIVRRENTSAGIIPDESLTASTESVVVEEVRVFTKDSQLAQSAA